MNGTSQIYRIGKLHCTKVQQLRYLSGKYSLEIFKMLGNPRQEFLNGLVPGIPGITLGTLFILFIGNRIGTITADGTPAHLPCSE